MNRDRATPCPPSATRRLRGVWLALVAALGVGCVSAVRQEKAAGQVGLGAAYLREGNVPGAVTTLEKAAKLDPRNWAAHNKLGLAYMAAGAPEKAEKAFQRALKLNDDEPEIQVNYGNLLFLLGRLDEAADAFATAAANLKYRKPSLALSNLGLVQLRMGRAEQALLTLDEAIRRAPNLCQARFNRGLVHDELGSAALALEDFEVVIELCGEEATGAYVQAARLLLDQNERNSGCTYLLTAVQDAGNSPLGREARKLHERECG